jgi:very-short-patch-repair endonuclease
MLNKRGQVLVAIMNEPRDLDIAREKHWYRIPVPSVERFLKDRWAPELLAFYQTKAFGEEGYAVNYFARVLDIHKVTRRELFPEEVGGRKAEQEYYKVMLSPLERLTQPILSRRFRRIAFIPTTLEKFAHAVEINDLCDASPLEDRLWAVLKLNGIPAERQEFIDINGRLYELDFAVYCADGNLDIETDGDTWHATPERIPLDNRRDNDLQTAGWSHLRFNTKQIREEIAEYCVPKIQENIARLGGLDKQTAPLSTDDSSAPLDWQQLMLFRSAQSAGQPKRKKRLRKAHRKGLA